MAVNVDWLVGRELVALHVASNQIEFIFSDPGAAGNDWAVSRGDYSISGVVEAGQLLRFSVPTVSPSMLTLLDRRVASAVIIDGGDLKIEFDACGALILHGEDSGSYELHNYRYPD